MFESNGLTILRMLIFRSNIHKVDKVRKAMYCIILYCIFLKAKDSNLSVGCISNLLYRCEILGFEN